MLTEVIIMPTTNSLIVASLFYAILSVIYRPNIILIVILYIISTVIIKRCYILLLINLCKMAFNVRKK